MTQSLIEYAIRTEVLIMALRVAFMATFAASLYLGWVCYGYRKRLRSYRTRYAAMYKEFCELRAAVPMIQTECKRLDKLFRKTSQVLTERNAELEVLNAGVTQLRRVA